MADYTLHCFAQSGNAYKAALMLQLSGADWTPRFVDFFNGETRTPDYRALNVMGEVPVLIDHAAGNRAFTQSGVILTWLSRRLGTFAPEGEDGRFEVLRWLLFDNHKLTSYIATYRFLVNFAGKGDSAEAAFLRGRALAALKVLDTHLSGREWVAADRPTIADLSLCGYLFWPDEFGVSWDDYPHVGAWTKRIAALPGWVHPYELMPGHPLPAKTN